MAIILFCMAAILAVIWYCLFAVNRQSSHIDGTFVKTVNFEGEVRIVA